MKKIILSLILSGVCSVAFSAEDSLKDLKDSDQQTTVSCDCDTVATKDSRRVVEKVLLIEDLENPDLLQFDKDKYYYIELSSEAVPVDGEKCIKESDLYFFGECDKKNSGRVAEKVLFADRDCSKQQIIDTYRYIIDEIAVSDADAVFNDGLVSTDRIYHYKLDKVGKIRLDYMSAYDLRNIPSHSAFVELFESIQKEEKQAKEELKKLREEQSNFANLPELGRDPKDLHNMSEGYWVNIHTLCHLDYLECDDEPQIRCMLPGMFSFRDTEFPSLGALAKFLKKAQQPTKPQNTKVPEEVLCYSPCKAAFDLD